ncbi:MAG: hypothetical protein NZM04_05320 [Methylacidiphilales bacterium]|nr:hypothetical protein [Candidatus Methylacidiphilales bacterium]
MEKIALDRFLQPDLIGFDSGDINLYRYVGNNAVNYTDPSGLIGPAGIALIGMGIGAVGSIYCEVVVSNFKKECEKKTEAKKKECELKNCNFEPEHATRQCGVSSYSGPCGGRCVR